jgi:rod shape-determining protein MreC
MPRFWERRKPLLVLAFFVVLHLFLISIQVPRGSGNTFFEKGIHFVFSPVQRGVVSVFHAVANLWKGYFDLRDVRAESRELKLDLFFARQENWFLEDRLKYFEAKEETRTALEAFKDSLILARVVGVDTANRYNSLVVNKGLVEGVQIDMAVCDRFGNLVGRTVEPISFNEATIQLITDERCSVSVVSEVARLYGVLSGTSGELCLLDYVFVTTEGGEVNERLLTTGYDGIYPAGLRVGRILSIQPREGTVFKDIVVQPFYRFNSLDAVALLPVIREDEES